jgi:nucleotide-binding universal stress UspA family protein
MDDRQRQTVVVGVGESLAALQALRYAVTEARRRDALLRAVRAWQLNVYGPTDDWNTGRMVAGAKADAMIRRAFQEAMGGLPRDLSFELMAVEGAVGPVLVAQASHPDDLLVLGAPSRSWWSPSPHRLVRYCMRAASCPVALVPAPTIVKDHNVKASARAIHREAERYVRSRSESRQRSAGD